MKDHLHCQKGVAADLEELLSELMVAVVNAFLQISASRLSAGVRGGMTARSVRTLSRGSGNDPRSIFPLGDSGIGIHFNEQLRNHVVR